MTAEGPEVPIESAVAVTDVAKTFGRGERALPTLASVSVNAAAGEFVTVVGNSGCGKSTLFNVIAGLELPDTGEVRLHGELSLGVTGRVGYMPQRDLLLPWRRLLDNVTLGIEIAGGDLREARREAAELLPDFGLEGFAESYPHQLSGGMRQRAALLRTILTGHDVLLLDEPFGSLDALTRLEMQQWLLDIWEHFGKTILFISHDVDEAILLSDRVYVMSPRPATIVAEIAIELERPRRLAMTAGGRFEGYKRALLEHLGVIVSDRALDGAPDSG